MVKTDISQARAALFLGASLLLAAFAASACSDSVPSDQSSSSSSSGDVSSSSSGSGGTGGAGGAGPDCYPNPMKHIEIINACTNAEKVDKQPDLPLLGPDGKLPPLP